MPGHPERRTPVEIWERILLSVITLDSQTAPFFDATCTAASYLAFKRTCGDGKSDAYRQGYRISEQNRHILRLVCHAWKDFADRWDMRRRWIRVDSLQANIDEETWRGVLRIDLLGTKGAMYPGDEYRGDMAQVMKTWFLQWKMLGVSGGYGMRVQRLEMLHLPKEHFKEVFKSLCGASKVLKTLRSLSITLPSNETRCFRDLSVAFPDLTHLTLRLTEQYTKRISADDSTAAPAEEDERRGVLIHRNIEVLFIYSEQFIKLNDWRLPQLQHVHLKPSSLFWSNDIYPFLERHASTILSLDLDDTQSDLTLSSRTSAVTHEFQLGFWETFSHLELLRCNLYSISFENYPRADHPLKHLVDTDPIEYAKTLVKILKPWVDGPSQASLKSVALFGPYLSKGWHKWEGGEVKKLLQLMKWNGVRLINPAGREWIESI